MYICMCFCVKNINKIEGFYSLSGQTVFKLCPSVFIKLCKYILFAIILHFILLDRV